MKPLEPTLTERFFDYPPDAEGEVLPYWLGAGGQLVRMTPACKRAFCATLEACMERATAIANAASSFVSFDYKTTDWGASPVSAFSAVDLGVWQLSGDRAAITSAFCRGCPKEDMDNLVRTTWGLWSWINPYTIHVGDKHADVYAWQTNLWAQQDGSEWQPDLSTYPIEITWSFSLNQTPCDSEWTQVGRQAYAPWGSYKGPRWPKPDAPMNWLSGELAKLERQNIYVPLSVFEQTSMHELLEEGSLNPQALGPLSRGRLGNWMHAAQYGASQATIRRSSAEWAVLQDMLANMKYTALEWDYSGTYQGYLSCRRYDRGWYMDPATFQISCADLPMSADTETSFVDTNFLISESYIDYLHGAAAYDIKFSVPEEDFDTFIRDVRPMGGWEYFPEAQQYAVGLRAGEYGGAGKSTVFLYANKTAYLISTDSSAPEPYPSFSFQDYVQERYAANFVDDKMEWISSSMDADTHMHRVVQEDVDANLSNSVFLHCSGLLEELPGPRGFPGPGSIGNIRRYNNQWWDQWMLYYPEEPNWPPYDPNPTQWAPQAAVSPGDFGRCHFLDKSGDQYPTDWGAAVFGTFETAFPDYPYGWDNQQRTIIRCSGRAMRQYKWQFKAMPAGGSSI